MTIVGINYTTNESGIKVYTLHISEDFADYYKAPESGRACIGKRVQTIYAGTYDCSNLKVGMEIDIYYDKAVSTSKGTYQNVKKIEILTK